METLEDKMEDALINNRVEFVDLLLEKGVSMKKFLTTDRLNNLFEAVTVSTTHDDVHIIAVQTYHSPVFTLLLASAYVSRTGMGWWLPLMAVE